MSAHPVSVRGPAFLGRNAEDDRPVVLQRTDPDFLEAVLNELKTDGGRRTLRGSLAGHVGGKLRLYQPVHRTFHLVMVEAHCLALGAPRLDPRKLDGAGVVVRRILNGKPQGWMQGKDGFRGWLPLSKAEQDADPDPERRPLPTSGHADIDRMLVRTGLVGARAEAFTPIYPAPPETCAAMGHTVLYGMLQLTSTETTATPPEVTFTLDEARDFLPGLLRSGVSSSVPSAGSTLYSSSANGTGTVLRNYLQQLEQLFVQLDLKGTSALSKKLQKELKDIQVEYGNGDKDTAYNHLVRAIDVLVNRNNDSSGVRMPVRWPAISSQQHRKFTELLRDIYTEKLSGFAPRIGRFDRQDAEYEARVFIRVKNEDGCPPTLYWSKVSERFRIEPWYANGPVPPVTIQLPDITRDSVKKLKPNVAFQVPSSLFNMLQANDPKKLADGEGKEGPSNPMIAWICGFNIPIITLCAFIVLSIFLALFNIIFFWLPFIKICIPIPSSWKAKQ